jgi:hypothetical protein
VKKYRLLANISLLLWIVGTQIWYYRQFAGLLTGMLGRMLHSH